MEHNCVKDLMVPISKYATVTVGTSLLDAILALEKAQEAYTSSKYQHRAILVLDSNRQVVGRVSQLRILKAIETRHDLDSDMEKLSNFRFSEEYIAGRREQERLNGPVLNSESLRAALEKKVEHFMQKPTLGEFVSEDSSIDIAIHKLVAGAHASLLVTSNHSITGVLRLPDVFSEVFHEMRIAGMTPR